MTLQSSGPISLSNIQGEFGGPSVNKSLRSYYRNGSYVNCSPANAGIPTSGQISIKEFYGANHYVPPPKQLYKITCSGAYTIPSGVSSVGILAVGGGGGGGGSQLSYFVYGGGIWDGGGGGGSGGAVYGQNVSITGPITVIVTIGAGGPAALRTGSCGGQSGYFEYGGNGGDTTIADTSYNVNIRAYGGGGGGGALPFEYYCACSSGYVTNVGDGGYAARSGHPGGSGGGGNGSFSDHPGGSATQGTNIYGLANYGNPGGTARDNGYNGGGGGLGASGGSGVTRAYSGAGGSGTSFAFGSTATPALGGGGGGGASYVCNGAYPPGCGGSGGGGRGGAYNSAGCAGTQYTGGGGGGGGGKATCGGGPGGGGGAGVVYLYY